MSKKLLRARIAPTPSGFLHFGNAFNFILTWYFVRRRGGKLVLRIDDLDTQRVRDEYLEDIFTSLDWLGLDWDEGAKNITEYKNKFSQNKRIGDYFDQINFLKQSGHCYFCECSRKSIREKDPSGRYHGICRSKDLGGHGKALRIEVPSGVKNYSFGELDLQKEMGDFIIVKKDGSPSYQVASFVDDLKMNINLIVRGDDLIASTGAQEFLAKTILNNSFINIKKIHHPLILDNLGKKLSKSNGSEALVYLRDHGIGPSKVYQKVGQYLGSQKLPNTLSELLEIPMPPKFLNYFN